MALCWRSFPNKMCKWKIWQNGEIFEATASSKGSMKFLKCDLTWTVTLFFITKSCRILHCSFDTIYEEGEMYKLLQGTISICTRTLIINITEKPKNRVFQECQGLGSCCFLQNLECTCPLLWREQDWNLETWESDSVWSKERQTLRNPKITFALVEP